MRHASTYNNIVHVRLERCSLRSRDVIIIMMPWRFYALASDLIKGNEHDRIASEAIK